MAEEKNVIPASASEASGQKQESEGRAENARRLLEYTLAAGAVWAANEVGVPFEITAASTVTLIALKEKLPHHLWEATAPMREDLSRKFQGFREGVSETLDDWSRKAPIAGRRLREADEKIAKLEAKLQSKGESSEKVIKALVENIGVLEELAEAALNDTRWLIHALGPGVQEEWVGQLMGIAQKRYDQGQEMTRQDLQLILLEFMQAGKAISDAQARREEAMMGQVEEAVASGQQTPPEDMPETLPEVG